MSSCAFWNDLEHKRTTPKAVPHPNRGDRRLLLSGYPACRRSDPGSPIGMTTIALQSVFADSIKGITACTGGVPAFMGKST